MTSVASQLIEEVTAHAQSDSLEDAREICADGTYFPNNLRTVQNIKYWFYNLDGLNHVVHVNNTHKFSLYVTVNTPLLHYIYLSFNIAL